MTIRGKNVTEFAADLDKFAVLMGMEHDKVLKRAVYQVWRNVIARSPVRTGRFRASWGASRDAIPDDPGEPEDSGKLSAAVARGRYNPQSFKNAKFHIWFVYNNLPYAVPLEEGHSQQAPVGIVGPALADAYADIHSTIKAKIGE